MRKLLTLLVLLGVLAGYVSSTPKDPPTLFKGLQVSYTCMSWTDLVFTTWALKTGNYSEANPIARFYVRHTAWAMGILTASDVLVHYGLTKLYSESKTWSWIVLIAFNVARGYILYHNLRIVK